MTLSTPRQLEGKVALITGAGGGIGRATALAFARAGASVVVSDVNPAGGEESVALIAAAGGNAIFHRCDVADAASVKALVARTVDHFGRLDFGHNNAGITNSVADEWDDDVWRRSLAINLDGVMHCMREEAAAMLQNGGGAIVNTASIAGFTSNARQPAYVAAKHGVIGLTKVVGLETATSNVTCNAICPGWVLTPLVQKQIDDRVAAGVDPQQAQQDLLAEKQPSLEFVTPSQLGELVLFLCSEAGAQVRGAAWNIDGGWLAQ